MKEKESYYLDLVQEVLGTASQRTCDTTDRPVVGPDA